MNFKIYQKNLLLPFLKLLIDGIMLESAFISAFYLRFNSIITHFFPVTKGYPSYHDYLPASFLLLIFYLLLYALFNSYRSRSLMLFSQDISTVIKVSFLGILFSMSGAFLYREVSYSRLTVGILYLNTMIFVTIGRLIYYKIRTFFMRRGFSIRRVILAGKPQNFSYFLKKLQADRNSVFQCVGYIADEPANLPESKYLGTTQNIPEILNTNKADGLVLAMGLPEYDRGVEILQQTEGMNVEIYYLPDLLTLMTSHTDSIEIAGIPLLRLKAVSFSGWQGFSKRAFDLIVSCFSLIVLSPIFALLAVLVKLSSPGPVFYHQKRIGLDGKEFKMTKFRSMRADAEKNTGPVWARADDDRVTTVGKFLRRSSLDELPQLLNVFRGEMSLVGPRPERKVFVEQFQERIPHYAERHRVRSGMTGWAQINGMRGQSPIEQRTKYDVHYIENWSLWLDIKIIILTFVAIWKGENAY